MPNRIVRESILTSSAVNGLSIESELVYRRLMSVADDFGRFDGRAGVIRASAFPLRLEEFPEARIEHCLEEIAAAKLILRYEVDGKPFIEVLKFNQRTRANTSKFPSPSRQSTVTGHTSDGRVTAPCRSPAHGDGDGDEYDSSLRVRQFLERYPRKTDMDAAARMWISIVTAEDEPRVLTGLERWIDSDEWTKDGGQWIPSPVKFLEKRRWKDLPKDRLNSTPLIAAEPMIVREELR